MTKPTIQHARKMVELLGHGLCKGVGQPKPGEMCILAVKRNVFGLSHGDSGEDLPIGSAVRSFDIALNDCAWSSNAARAKGMARLALAEFGSNEIDQNLFVKELVLATVRKIVPLALRAAAGMKGNADHKEKLQAEAKKCEAVQNLKEARAAASAASYASAASAASYAASAASYASYAASYASAASYAVSYAASAASYASYAASAASAASYAASYAKDEVLTTMAECAVQALIVCKSPGCQWLYLCDEKEAA